MISDGIIAVGTQFTAGQLNNCILDWSRFFFFFLKRWLNHIIWLKLLIKSLFFMLRQKQNHSEADWFQTRVSGQKRGEKKSQIHKFFVTVFKASLNGGLLKKKGPDLLNVLALSRGWLPPSWLTVSIKARFCVFSNCRRRLTCFLAFFYGDGAYWNRVSVSGGQRSARGWLLLHVWTKLHLRWQRNQTLIWGAKTKARRFNQLPLGKVVSVNKVPSCLFK